MHSVSGRTLVTWPVTIPDSRYFCPHGHSRPASLQLSLIDMPRMIWCTVCKTSFSSNSWTCSCGITWHNCCHVHHPPLSSRVKRGTGTTFSCRASSAEDSERHLQRLEPGIVSRALMGPKLSARFHILLAHRITLLRMLPLTSPIDRRRVSPAAEVPSCTYMYQSSKMTMTQAN